MCVPSTLHQTRVNQGRIKTFARLLKQAAERDGWVTDKCRFDFHMSFRVACTYPALLELASTKSNQVSSMSDLPGGDQVAWRPLPCIHNWTYGPSDLAKPWVPNGYLA
jgi:hypothetical protein